MTRPLAMFRSLVLLAMTGLTLAGCYVVDAPPPAVYGGGYGYYGGYYGRPYYRPAPPAYGYYGRPYHHHHWREW